MRILLLGANGQVGFELLRSLAPLGEVIPATRDGELANGRQCLRADLAEPVSLAQAMEVANPDVIVNAAAYTAVDRAEQEPDLADRVNHLALAQIGGWGARHDALVVHYSTDYVFDGSARRPYSEGDATAPQGAYGRSKLAGEEALRGTGAAYLIFRTAWIYAARGGNFLRTMLRLGSEREEMRIVVDQVGAPTPASWIADATAAALMRWHDTHASSTRSLDGIYHLVAGGQCTWFEFAEAIFREASSRGLIARVPRVVPIATADYPTPARRPAYSVLDCSRLDSVFGLQLGAWPEGLRAVLDEIARNTIPSHPFA
ncbi:MAG: dTDP-4-dehydrorhamnose reductase [Dokdonella sp.]